MIGRRKTATAVEEVDIDEIRRLALEGTVPIAETAWRQQVKVAGRVRAMRVQPWADGVATLEVTLDDGTGGITVVFLGRRHIGGIRLGTHLVAEGTVGETHGRLAILNPAYTILP